MARHTWHKALNRMRDSNYLLLSLEARAVLAGLEDLMAGGETLDGNLATLALYLGVDQKKYRLKTHLDTLLEEGYIKGACQDRGKKGLWYTLDLPDNHPEKSEKGGGKGGESSEKGSRKGQETGGDKSAQNAAFGDSSLKEKENKNLPSEGEEKPAAPPASKSTFDTGRFQAHLEVLQGVANYPLMPKTDLDFLTKLDADFPTIDLLGSLKCWAAYKLDNPLKPKESPRSQIRTWVGKDLQWGRNLKSAAQAVTAPPPTPRHLKENVTPEQMRLRDEVTAKWMAQGKYAQRFQAFAAAGELTLEELRRENDRAG